LGDELDDSGKSAEDAGGKFDKLGGILKGIGVAMGAVAVAAGAAAIKLGKEVVQQFGELEQNLGGSEAVFGAYAASIQKTGEEAYRNLGVSQSEYLATANKMGALFQGSGIQQQKSLELTEKAMQRAADMASVMGVDMQMALDSVAGAAKGNFTMMDNLGVAMNATNIQAYALAKGLDFTWNTATQAEKAEIAMQMFFENTEQYAGNFARESTQTITGSIGMLQAALGSFTGGLGNANADMTNLTENLVDAFRAVVANIVPVLENIVTALP
ncbi:MAG TPA: phage tail protein, partial [Ruminococcaceae bacterium]|nr:phage tail protein [Oscillospiraceae bacterium]